MPPVYFSAFDEALKEKIKRAGQDIFDKYCTKRHGQATMLPPIPYQSKFIYEFPVQGSSNQKQEDRRKQEAYAAEVLVYRALESLKEQIVCLQGLSYTSRQLALFEPCFKHDSEKPNKVAGKCDFIVIGEDYIVIIEVSSDVWMDENETYDERLTTVFENKKRQAEKTLQLIKRIFTGSGQSIQNYPHIDWFCAFCNLSEASAKSVFQEDQQKRIIFMDSLTMGQHCFLSWWKENITGVEMIHSSRFDDDRMKYVRSILIGLWNIDSQNQCNFEKTCSIGLNILAVDRQLRNAQQSYGFSRHSAEIENQNYVVADKVFQQMGINQLSNEQNNVFKNEANLLWINGPAGSGKTLLILGRAIQLAETSKEKVVIVTAVSRDRSKNVYQKSLGDAGISFEAIRMAATKVGSLYSQNQDEIAKSLAAEIWACVERSCKVVLVEFGHKTSSLLSRHARRQSGGLQIINKVIDLILQRTESSEKVNFFIDDEQCLLENKSRQKQKFIYRISNLKESCKIWICRDVALAQSIDHKALDSFPSALPTTLMMMLVYDRLTLSANFRNTCDISNTLAIIREKIVVPPMQQSYHYVHGPAPVFHDLLDYVDGDVHTICETVIEEELEKVMDSDQMKATDICLIGNTDHSTKVLEKILEKLTIKTSEITVCNLLHTYSAEWPVIIFLMDLTGITYEDSLVLHQLYLALSRARVYFSSVLYSTSSGEDRVINKNLHDILQTLERHVTVSKHIPKSG